MICCGQEMAPATRTLPVAYYCATCGKTPLDLLEAQEIKPLDELRADVLTQSHGAFDVEFEDKPDPFHTEDWARP